MESLRKNKALLDVQFFFDILIFIRSHIFEQSLVLAMIIVFRYLFYNNYVGLSFWPFIFIKHHGLKKDSILINHEKIHLRQQLELLILPFYALYVLEWLLRTFWYLNAYRAYQNISFEREAYANEHNPAYLSRRRPFSFLRYL